MHDTLGESARPQEHTIMIARGHAYKNKSGIKRSEQNRPPKLQGRLSDKSPLRYNEEGSSIDGSVKYSAGNMHPSTGKIRYYQERFGLEQKSEEINCGGKERALDASR